MGMRVYANRIQSDFFWHDTNAVAKGESVDHVGMRCAHRQMHGGAVNGSGSTTSNRAKSGNQRGDKRRLGKIRRAWAG